MKMEVPSEGEGKCPPVAQSTCFQEPPRWTAPSYANQQRQQWVDQWQQFLQTFPFLQLARQIPEVTEATPWEDPKTFLASFERVAKACHWPREEWASRLAPALHGEAEKAVSKLEAGDREDYGKVKAIILQGEAIRTELQRQLFRQFRYREMENPHRVYGQLQELCRQWLKPERHTKEQIMDLVILEQFQAILPQEIQNWMEEGRSQASVEAVALVEDFLKNHQEAKGRVLQGPWQEMLPNFLGAEGAPRHFAQREIRKESKQKSDSSIPLPLSRITLSSSSGTTPCTEGWEATEGGRTEGTVNFEAGTISSDAVESSMLKPIQSPMYWEVMEESAGITDISGGILIPKAKLFPSLGSEEIIFIKDAKDGDTFPGSRIPNGKQNENLLRGSPRQRKLPRVQSGEHQGIISLRPETCKMRRSSGRPQKHSKKMPQMDEVFREGTAASQQEKKCQCPACGHQANSASDLAKHRRTHTEEKLYMCFECKKGFYGASALYGHLRVHRGKASSKGRKKPPASASPTEGTDELSKFRDKDPQQGKNEPVQVPSSILVEIFHSQVAEIHETECKAEGQKAVQAQNNPIQLSDLQASRTGTVAHTWVKQLLYSQCGKTSPSKAGDVIQEGPCAGNNVGVKEYQNSHTGEKL